MKIYLLSHGEYSDYSILGTFSSEEKARAARGAFDEEDTNPLIEEFELDELCAIPPGYKLWQVSMDRNGNLPRDRAENVRGPCRAYPHKVMEYLDPQPVSFAGPYPFSKQVGHFVVLARDGDHAVKIAGELRVKAIHEGRWQLPKETP